eukprot:IDg10497t1
MGAPYASCAIAGRKENITVYIFSKVSKYRSSPTVCWYSALRASSSGGAVAASYMLARCGIGVNCALASRRQCLWKVGLIGKGCDMWILPFGVCFKIQPKS